MQQIWDYLTQEKLRAIDVIIITVVSSIVYGIISGFVKSVGKSTFLKLSKSIKNVIRKYVKQKPSFNELIDMERRVNEGEHLKWYERIGYYKAKKNLLKAVSKHKLSNGLDPKTFNNQMNELNNIKDKLKL
ncbi:hypothetical protein [Aquibacillus kalidii]|uniref:hypothetical protein n=1 Tax=Aquibacillus kalidii TaxID=2762597 RepID=UPI0016458AD1|nr:hypothetical protein [Aquibacillus kalidii]